MHERLAGAPGSPTCLPCSRSMHCTVGWLGITHRSMSAPEGEGPREVPRGQVSRSPAQAKKHDGSHLPGQPSTSPRAASGGAPVTASLISCCRKNAAPAPLSSHVASISRPDTPRKLRAGRRGGSRERTAGRRWCSRGSQQRAGR